MFSETFIYYSVIGYDKNNKDSWFPVFCTYPNINKIKLLEYKESQVKEAENNIDTMLKTINIFKIKSVAKCFSKEKDLPIDETNFGVFMVLLMSNSIVSNISNIINLMPNEIQVQFQSILSEIQEIINNEENYKKLFSIISHNLIITFIQIFTSKYKEIESHMFCLQCPVQKSEIEAQQRIAKNEFFGYDSKIINLKSTTTHFQFVDKKNKALSKISLIQLPESKGEECYIISENEPPKPDLIKNGLKSFSFKQISKEKSFFSKDVESITSLPTIELPDILSISTLNLFYSTCSQGATILPTYIRSMSKQIKNNNQKISQQYFALLLDIYMQVTAQSTLDRSILSENVNSFIKSFKNCVQRLKRAGVIFDNVKLPQSCNDCTNTYSQDFIRSLVIDPLNLRHIQWKTKYEISENYMKYIDKFKPQKYIQYNLNSLSSPTPIKEEEDIDDDDEDEIIPHPNIPVTEEEKIKTQQQVNLIWVRVGNKEVQQSNQPNPSILPIKPPEPQIKTTLKINKNDIQQQIVDQKIAKQIYPKFTESDGIERVLLRISEMIKSNKIKFSNSTECIIENQNKYFKPSKYTFPVQELINQSQHLIANLIFSASNTNCPFLYMSCNLLIDCSCYIDIQNKLYNFMILISFSYALSALEIPFSIAIVADQKFRFVLKPFDEELSALVLQRVLDCLFITRYKTNIPDTLHYTIKYMKCPYKERTQRALFLFSNGIDENLKLTQDWKESLLKDQNISFGLIFLKSKFLENSRYNEIIEMWNDFGKAIKSNNVLSIARMAVIDFDVNLTTLSTISTLFAEVLNRNKDQKYDFDVKKIDVKPVFKESYNELTENVFENARENINIDFTDMNSSIYRKSSQKFNAIGSKFPKYDVSYYKNKTGNITNSIVSTKIKEQFEQFVYYITYSKRNAYRPILESIFRPNKASETVLSDTGTDFDITALILNLINPVPNPLIYLEEKGGLVRNYGISIIIDSSKSCFNPLSSSHSYQSIKTLLASLALIDIPCIDVIIATKAEPIVLCSEVPSLRFFNNKSSFWSSLFNCLSEQNDNQCNLEAAIHAEFDIRRMRSVDFTSYMFVFTDGLFQKEQKDLIKNHIMTCIQSGILVFGIGIGIYPSGIDDIFPQAIYATNPNYLIHGIALCFGDDSIESYSDAIKQLAPTQTDFSLIETTFDQLIKNENSPIFSELKRYLQENVKHSMDAFSDMHNDEVTARNEHGELVNPEEGKNTQMYIKDFLKGQKILIVMLYKCIFNLMENPKINPKYLSSCEFAGDNANVKNAVNFFGIEIKIVENYKDAVNELTKNVNGKCDYYATWVISGLPYDKKLPDGGNQHLVIQFIDCLIQFWKNGGSVVMFAESDPFTFQANLFLERIEFPNNIKTKLRVGGNHEGTKYLKADKTGELKNPGMFNKKDIYAANSDRPSLSHNLVEIYEGETISFVKDDESHYYPFTPFMKDSDGGISALFYQGDLDKENMRGDIIIDCGYTKLFDKMTEKGTFRYIQNIAAWTAQCETKRIRGIEPKNYRPNAVVFTLDESVKISIFKESPKSIISGDLQSNNIGKLKKLFAIDHSGSVGGVDLYHKKVELVLRQYNKSNDKIITWGSETKEKTFEEMKKIYENKEGNEGTYPKVIAEFLKDHPSIPCEHLILITDGEVSSTEVKNCDDILKENNIHFKYVTTYVICTGCSVDLSVGAPFARGCPSTTIEIKKDGSERSIEGPNAVDLSVLDAVDQIKDGTVFDQHSNSLIIATINKNIGTNDPILKEKFEKLKERLNESGSLNPRREQLVDILIGMAGGTLNDLFDIDKIITMRQVASQLSGSST